MIESADVAQIEPAEAERRMAGGAILLDVREPDEWEGGHAEAARHVPLSELPAKHHQLSHDGEIVAVCRSGGRSQKAAEYLKLQGFAVSNLAGGMQAWAASGFPVVRDDANPGVVI